MAKTKKVKEEEVKEEVKQEEGVIVEVPGVCSNCGKPGFKVTIAFCSEACRDAFLKRAEEESKRKKYSLFN